MPSESSAWTFMKKYYALHSSKGEPESSQSIPKHSRSIGRPFLLNDFDQMYKNTFERWVTVEEESIPE